MRLDAQDPAAIDEAADRLAAGELVAFPTETVYGLGARADDDAAAARIFEAKGRPAGHPLIVHVADAAAAAAFAAQWPPLAQRLAEHFWPGPLTVIVPRADGVAAVAAGGQPTVGLRCPSHPVALALLRAAAARGVRGVAGPSANRFGRVSPTTAAHVESEFGDAVAVLDGGACDVGIESAIVDCTRGVPVLLRPGVLTPQEIEQAAGQPLVRPDGQAPRAPGTLASHYAPHAKVRLMPAAALREALAVFADAATAGNTRSPTGKTLAVYSRTVLPPPGAAHHRRMPDDAAAAAQALFATLRDLDGTGVSLIWVEQPPAGPEWDGVRDRLQRAAAD
ncbi:L-threonylcarbamoyladenylate synthase [Aquincola sp. MAHUQ-54]|uniref:Threonylcarbamoyl-AMP synthase n=1 Tax=Aquincola agrisoli TaxID=3119538 RepID=A0AAW9QGE9_9BURK